MDKTCHIESKATAPRLLRVPFGRKDGRMWTARQVPKGLECGCTCPGCNGPLVAKAQDSTERQPHFAHHRETDCRAGFESAVHLMAKQLIVDQMRVQLPAWSGDDGMPNPPSKLDDRGECIFGRTVQFPNRLASLTSAEVEVRRGDYIPDLTCVDEQGTLLIEIRVHHAVGGLKLRRVQSDGVRMVEIDLSTLTTAQVLDDVEFQRLVLDESGNRAWISCPEATEEWRASFEALKQAVLERNRQIRKEASDAGAKRALELSKARAQQANKDANRTAMRAQLRSPYEFMLSSLPELTSPARIDHLLAEHWARDREKAEAIFATLESPAISRVLQRWHSDAWVYRAHPVYWQAAVYEKFIATAAVGDAITQQEAARWARDEFGIDPVLKLLFDAQYQARAEARNFGYRKFAIEAWFFSEAENAAIPNIYEPFNDLFQRLVDADMIHPLSGGPGRYTRTQPRPAAVHAARVHQVLPTPVPVRRLADVTSPLISGSRIEHNSFGCGTVEQRLVGSSHVFAVLIDGEGEARTLMLSPERNDWRLIE